jgi:DNA-binding GntR family transcriptional regulator
MSSVSNLDAVSVTHVDIAFLHVRDAVLRGTLRPNQRINQSTLVQQLGMSLVPIREALRKLASEGYVRILPHRGVYVSPISRDEMEDVYAIRLALEGMATKEGVMRITDQEVEKLAQLISSMDVALQSRDHTQLLELNQRFHYVLYAASGRDYLCGLISHLWEKSLRYRTSYILIPERANQAHEEHKDILSAVRERSVKKAIQAVRNNIRQTMLGLLTSFDEEESRLGRRIPRADDKGAQKGEYSVSTGGLPLSHPIPSTEHS